MLCQAANHHYAIFAKVGLDDLLTVRRGPLKYLAYRNQISQKHVDFILCSPDDLTPLLVIELDDSSHARLGRRERDAFVDAALAAAGLPILHVPPSTPMPLPNSEPCSMTTSHPSGGTSCRCESHSGPCCEVEAWAGEPGAWLRQEHDRASGAGL